MTKYEVQMIACDRTWINTWYVHHADSSVEQETFNSYDEAWEAVMEFLAEIDEEIICGQREPDNGYSIGEFRVMPVDDVAHG